MVAGREEPIFDMTVLPRQLVIAFANLFPAALLDPFGEMKGRHDRDLDFGRDPEQPERQALRLIEVGGQFNGRLVFRNEDEKRRARKWDRTSTRLNSSH